MSCNGMGHGTHRHKKADASHCKHAKGIPPSLNGNRTRLISRWTSAKPYLLDPATRQAFMQIAE
jgi:hypothetical protein